MRISCEQGAAHLVSKPGNGAYDGISLASISFWVFHEQTETLIRGGIADNGAAVEIGQAVGRASQREGGEQGGSGPNGQAV